MQNNFKSSKLLIILLILILFIITYVRIVWVSRWLLDTQHSFSFKAEHENSCCYSNSNILFITEKHYFKHQFNHSHPQKWIKQYNLLLTIITEKLIMISDVLFIWLFWRRTNCTQWVQFFCLQLFVIDPIVIHKIFTMIHTIIRVELYSDCCFSLASLQTSEHV